MISFVKGLFFRKNRRLRLPAKAPSFRPAVECLEDRFVPAHLITSSTPSPLITLDAAVVSGHEVMLTGVVSDGNPCGVTVDFSGAVTGTTTTNLDGDFQFATTQAALGTVYAVGVDQSSRSTNVAAAVLTTPAPNLNVVVSATDAATVTLTGQMTGIDPGGETLAFSGAIGGSVVTDASGDFQLHGQR